MHITLRSSSAPLLCRLGCAAAAVFLGINVSLTSVGAQVFPPPGAPVFNGGGVEQGLGQAESGLQGVARGEVRSAVSRILVNVINFLGLVATIVIVAAGFVMVLSNGEEEKKEQAKKMIMYGLIGLVIVFFARVLVTLVTVYLRDVSN